MENMCIIIETVLWNSSSRLKTKQETRKITELVPFQVREEDIKF